MSRVILRKFFVFAIFLALFLPVAAAHASTIQGSPTGPKKRGPSTVSSAQTEPLPTDRIIIKFKHSDISAQEDADRGRMMVSISQSVGKSLTYFRAMSGDADVISLE